MTHGNLAIPLKIRVTTPREAVRLAAGGGIIFSGKSDSRVERVPS